MEVGCIIIRLLVLLCDTSSRFNFVLTISTNSKVLVFFFSHCGKKRKVTAKFYLLFFVQESSFIL